jgi:hypothetical protein
MSSLGVSAFVGFCAGRCSTGMLAKQGIKISSSVHHSSTIAKYNHQASDLKRLKISYQDDGEDPEPSN